MYWYKGKRLRNMRGCRWYKASTGFWRPAGRTGGGGSGGGESRRGRRRSMLDEKTFLVSFDSRQDG